MSEEQVHDMLVYIIAVYLKYQLYLQFVNEFIIDETLQIAYVTKEDKFNHLKYFNNDDIYIYHDVFFSKKPYD